jgi:RimJ/RimL family protein N-acetyltransferase
VSSRAPILCTERLALRELRDGDAAAVASGAGDRRVAKYLIQVPSPYPVSLARRWLIGRRDWWALGRGVTLAVTRRDEPDRLLGTVSLRRYMRDRRAELGYWLAVPAWGQGIATEAVRALVDFGFRELVLARVYAQVIEGNAGSIRVLEKIGMVREGVKRQHVKKGHRLCDVELFGMLRAEWGIED